MNCKSPFRSFCTRGSVLGDAPEACANYGSRFVGSQDGAACLQRGSNANRSFTIEWAVQGAEKSRHIAFPCSSIREEHTERLKLRNQSSGRRLSNGDQGNCAEFLGITQDPNELGRCHSDKL